MDLANSSWEFLEKTNYNKEGILCSKTEQGIVSILLNLLYSKMLPEMIKKSPEADHFPGKTGTDQLSDFSLSISISSGLMNSTGLYLPPGVVGIIEVDEPMPFVTVHIGLHQDIQYVKIPPWKRWPSISIEKDLSEKRIEISSPFGGIVNLMSNNPEAEITSVFNFRNFCQYPVYMRSDPSFFDKTKDNDVSWGEIVTNNVILTLPSSKLREITDFEKICEKIDLIADEVSKFVHYEQQDHYRIVFDIEEFEGMNDNYPITLNFDDMNDILDNIDEPNLSIFSLATSMALASMKEGFDNALELTLSKIAATYALKKLYKSFDPYLLPQTGKFPCNSKDLFEKLLQIDEENNYEAISKTIKYLDFKETVLENRKMFVSTLSKVIGRKISIPIYMFTNK